MRCRRAAGIVGTSAEALVAGQGVNPDFEALGHEGDGAAEDRVEHARSLDSTDAVFSPGAVEGDQQVPVELVLAQVAVDWLPEGDETAAT